MKKVLFATTALVATAGVAAADVTFGGYGRFGVLYQEGRGAGASATADATALATAQTNLADVRSRPTSTIDQIDAAQAQVDAAQAAVDASSPTDDSTDITSRFRLQIDATAESDAGVTFGARVRIQQNEGQQGMTNGARFFARSGGFEVGVGNIYGALEFMPGMYPIDLGLTGLGYDYTAYNFRGDAYSSGGLGNSGDNGVEVLWSGGDLSVHVSYSDTGDRLAGHIAYTWNGWTFALGGQDSDIASDTEWAVSAGGSFGVADVTLAYADNGTDGDHWVLAGRFDVGAATNVEIYVADADYFDDTSYGVDFNHDMGGGTSLRGGIASLNDGRVRADVGVRFNF